MGEFEVIGKRVPNINSAAKALGECEYVDDIRISGMLQGKVLRSPYPHARILHIDSSRAKALPGVKAVITGEDIPEVKFSTYPEWEDRHPLAKGKVRHIGEAIAAVVAIDQELAEEALELIRVDYEPLPHIFDPIAAMQPGAILIHDHKERNISNRLVKSYGDIERGFKEADYIREDAYRTAPNSHAALEPHGTISKWHDDGSLTIWANSQGPFRLRGRSYGLLGLAEDKIRVINTAVGGGFGGKVYPLDIHVASAHLSRITGKPVKIILNREEVFLCTHQRHPMFLTLRTGVKKDGTLICQEVRAIADGGAYTGSGIVVLDVGANQLMVPYILPHFRYEGIRVFTNKPMGGPMRGHGAPQVRFAVESQIDMIAKDLNIDPLDLRLRNSTYAGYNHPAGKRISSCGLKEALQEVAKALNWQQRKGKLLNGHGLGLACSCYMCGVKTFPHAGGGVIIVINMEGGVNVLSGAADIGQGIDTVLCQIVAEELGLKMEDIRLIAADTGLTPFDMGTFGSGVTFRMGNAAINAARDVKRQLVKVISPQLETSPEKIEFRHCKVYVQDDPQRMMTFKQAVKAYHYAGEPMPLVGRGFYEPDCSALYHYPGEPMPGRGFYLPAKEGPETPAYAFLCQGAEVKVDKETGRIKVLKLVSADDCGQAINTLNVEGQAEGAMIGGLGMALYEDLPHNEGKYLYTSLLNYPIPTALDLPADMSSTLIETKEPLGPFGAKEAGEGMLVSLSPAIANAIYDAIGVRITELPITPDKIIKAVEARKEISEGNNNAGYLKSPYPSFERQKL